MGFQRIIWALSLSILIFGGVASCSGDMSDGSSGEASWSGVEEGISVTYTSAGETGFASGYTGLSGISIGHGTPVYYPPGYVAYPPNTLSSATSAMQQAAQEGSLYDPKIKQIYDAMTTLLSDLADKKTKYEKGLMTKKDYQQYLSNMDMSLNMLDTMLRQAKSALVSQAASVPGALGAQTTPSNPP
jgi:hypothetical protein